MFVVVVFDWNEYQKWENPSAAYFILMVVLVVSKYYNFETKPIKSRCVILYLTRYRVLLPTILVADHLYILGELSRSFIFLLVFENSFIYCRPLKMMVILFFGVPNKTDRIKLSNPSCGETWSICPVIWTLCGDPSCELWIGLVWLWNTCTFILILVRN